MPSLEVLWNLLAMSWKRCVHSSKICAGNTMSHCSFVHQYCLLVSWVTFFKPQRHQFGPGLVCVQEAMPSLSDTAAVVLMEECCLKTYVKARQWTVNYEVASQAAVNVQTAVNTSKGFQNQKQYWQLWYERVQGEELLTEKTPEWQKWYLKDV